VRIGAGVDCGSGARVFFGGGAGTGVGVVPSGAGANVGKGSGGTGRNGDLRGRARGPTSMSSIATGRQSTSTASTGKGAPPLGIRVISQTHACTAGRREGR